VYEVFELTPGCYGLSESKSVGANGGLWVITQVFEGGRKIELKRREVGTGEREEGQWICTAGYTVDKCEGGGGGSKDCEDQERAKLEFDNMQYTAGSPTADPPTAGLPTADPPSAGPPPTGPEKNPSPTPLDTTLVLDAGSQYTIPLSVGFGVLLLFVASVGTVVVTRRRKTRAEESATEAGVGDPPFSPRTVRVSRAMDGETVELEGDNRGWKRGVVGK